MALLFYGAIQHWLKESQLEEVSDEDPEVKR